MTPCRALTPMLTTTPLRPLLRPTLLPFLYQTRSLRQFPPVDDHDIPMHSDSNPIEQDPWGYLYRAGTSTAAPLPPRRQPIRMDDAPPVTVHEREVFALIFKDLLNRAPERPAVPEERFQGTYGQRMFNHDNLAFTQPPDVIKGMLSDPKNFSLSFDGGERGVGLPDSLRGLAAAVARQAVAPAPAVVKPDSEELIAKRKQLEACETDLATLEFMEREVFTLLQHQSEAAVEMYPELLYTGLKVFADGYSDFSTCQALFKRAKALGAESYVMGCTTKVYTLMIRVLWVGLRDAQKVWELVEEMEINGIEPDAEAKKQVQMVLRDIAEQRAGLHGAVGKWLLDDGQVYCQNRLKVAVGNWIV